MRRILYILLGAMVIGLILLSIAGDRGLVELSRRRIIVSQLEREIEQLRVENARLSREVEALRSDWSYLEKLAREELEMIKPGEVLLLLTSDSNLPSKGGKRLVLPRGDEEPHYPDVGKRPGKK